MADISKIKVNNTEYNLKDSTVATQISNAIDALDVSSVGGTGKVISAISETNGKISATATTMDTVPTENSTNPVTSGGVYPVAVKAVDEGAKNRLFSDKAVGTTETIHGRTFTIQSDGGIKVETTGTVDADADFYLLGAWSNRSTLFDAESKTWTPVCNCATKSDNISLRIYNRSTGSTVASRTITSNDNAGINFDFNLTCAFIKIGSGQTIPSGGIVVYPMICTASDWAVSQKFVPYCPTMQEMYQMILALQSGTT